jgi:hypothetical protein
MYRSLYCVIKVSPTVPSSELIKLSWLKHEGFHEMVAKEWTKISYRDGPMAVWQNKIRHLRNFLRGWAKNHSGFYKKEKKRLLALIDRLDVQAETTASKQF